MCTQAVLINPKCNFQQQFALNANCCCQIDFIRMKSKAQSHQFPEYMSEYYREKQVNEQTLEIISEDTNDSIFHRKTFSICDIIGNFENGFILIHFEGYLYLVDQHAASEKSLFLQYMINPTQTYTCKADYKCYLPNYYRQTLSQKTDEIHQHGWKFEELTKKAGQTIVKITQAPLVYGKQLKEEDFIFFIDKLYNEKENNDNSYSNNERSYMASFACHNAIKVGDRLRLFEMRGLLDSLYKMDAPFNCPHGRPIIVSLGRIADRRPTIAFKRLYSL